MIGIIFERADEILEIRLSGTDLTFRHNSYGAGIYPLDSLKLSYEGALKDNPDLEDDPDWKKKSIERLKEKIKSYPNENDKVNYIIYELKKVGFRPKYKQKEGFRPERIK